MGDTHDQGRDRKNQDNHASPRQEKRTVYDKSYEKRSEADTGTIADGSVSDSMGTVPDVPGKAYGRSATGCRQLVLPARWNRPILRTGRVRLEGRGHDRAQHQPAQTKDPALPDVRASVSPWVGVSGGCERVPFGYERVSLRETSCRLASGGGRFGFVAEFACPLGTNEFSCGERR